MKQNRTAYMAEYYKKHKEQLNSKSKKNYADNREQKLAYQKKWDKENIDKVRQHTNAWRKRHPEFYRNYVKVRYATDLIFREIALVRNNTYNKYGAAKVCEFCGSTHRVQHHHFTKPYHIDLFIDLCYECHKKEKKHFFNLEE